MQHDLVDGPQQPAGGLRHVHHVRHEREALQLQLRYVRLQEDVDLRRGFFYALLYGDRYLGWREVVS